MTAILLEVCTGDFESVRHAVEAGARRIELCSSLAEGGLTPSDGLLALVRKSFPALNIQMLIRPRSGDFLYSDAEVAIMRHDIRRAEALGADGIVVGALTADGAVDAVVMRRLMSDAGRMEVVFHRAFDLCCNREEALEEIIALGCRRILTSGGAAKAEEGIESLHRLIAQASGRIAIMPGGGIDEQNVARIVQKTHAREVHASLRTVVDSKMRYRQSGVSMGAAGNDEYARSVTDSERVRRVIAELEKI